MSHFQASDSNSLRFPHETNDQWLTRRKIIVEKLADKLYEDWSVGIDQDDESIDVTANLILAEADYEPDDDEFTMDNPVFANGFLRVMELMRQHEIGVINGDVSAIETDAESLFVSYIVDRRPNS